MKFIAYLIRYRRWPSRLQRDFMSRSPARRARVRAYADQIIADMENDHEVD